MGEGWGEVYPELSRNSSILHVPIATRLVELVRGQTCSCCWRIRLNGVALVEQVLVVELLKEIPQGLYVLVVVCDVWVLKVNPVAHLVGELRPLVGVHHHILAAGVVIVVHAYLLAYILFGYAERLLHRQLYRQTMSIPSCLALNLIALHGLVSEERILDSTTHHVVYARMSVGRRRTLVENELRTTFLLVYTLMEYIVLLPFFKHLVVCIYKVKAFMFFEFHLYIILL